MKALLLIQREQTEATLPSQSFANKWDNIVLEFPGIVNVKGN